MAAKDNRALVHRYMQEVWAEHDPDAIANFIAPNYRRHLTPQAAPLDAEAQIERVHGFALGFPDITIVIDDIIADEHSVSFRATLQGTHLGATLSVGD